MKHKLYLFVFILLFVASPALADSSPEFSFTSLDGKMYTSSELKTIPLVINIGSHW